MKTESITIKDAAGLAADTILAAKQAAQDLARSMTSRLDEITSQSADALHSGADSVRTASQRGATAMADAGERVAVKLDAASSYVNQCSSECWAGSLRRTFSRHPVSLLIMASAFGFCAGSAISRARTISTRFKKEELQ